MKVIGVTGNHGSGKSTVSTIIKNNTGCTVISADIIAKKINVPGTEFYEKTVGVFGEEILNEDKTIDRKKMADKLFAEESLRLQMNVHTAKYAGDEIRRMIKEEEKSGKNDILVLDAPLLFECKLDDVCDYIIAVVCEDEMSKIKRICERDRKRPAQARLRLSAQPDNEFYTSRADYVVDNTKFNAYFDLIKKVLKIVHEIRGENKAK